MELDLEARADRARDALDALVDLMGAASPEATLNVVPLAQLLGLVFDAVKDVLPDHRPRHAAGANDDAD